MKLTIEGNDTKVKQLAKELRLRSKRNGLELSTDAVKDIDVDLDTPELTAKETIEIIKGITDIEDLEKFGSDTRKTVIDAIEHQKEAIQN